MNAVFDTHSVKEIADAISVAVKTVKRWKDSQKIPNSYRADIMKLMGVSIDYKAFSYSEKDQYFTPHAIAEYCIQKTFEIIKLNQDDPEDYCFIEPSAGDGSFFKLLPENRRVGLDIEPRHAGITQQDYLEYSPSTQQSQRSKYVVIGNPPFGLRGNLALRFINRSYEFADYVAFILPPIFDSDGRGACRKRVHEGYHLAHTEQLVNTFFVDPEDRPVNVATIFQIWTRRGKVKVKVPKTAEVEQFKVYSLSDGGTSSTTRNKAKLTTCDVYLPRTCFGIHNMRAYDTFEDLPNRRGYGVCFFEDKSNRAARARQIRWSDVAFRSTNAALNLRQSMIRDLIDGH
jgi:predicted RNA methylase